MMRNSFPATQGNPSREILTNSGFSYKKFGTRANTNSSSDYNFLTDEEILQNKNTKLNSTILGYQNEIRYLKHKNEDLNGIIKRLNADRSFLLERQQESPQTCGNIASIHRAIITEVKMTNFFVLKYYSLGKEAQMSTLQANSQIGPMAGPESQVKKMCLVEGQGGRWVTVTVSAKSAKKLTLVTL